VGHRRAAEESAARVRRRRTVTTDITASGTAARPPDSEVVQGNTGSGGHAADHGSGQRVRRRLDGADDVQRLWQRQELRNVRCHGRLYNQPTTCGGIAAPNDLRDQLPARTRHVRDSHLAPVRDGAGGDQFTAMTAGAGHGTCARRAFLPADTEFVRERAAVEGSGQPPPVGSASRRCSYARHPGPPGRMQ